MKYIVLSFDDGLIEFKNIALPILEKYNMKVTINIISGFSDKTIPTTFEYLNVDDIKELLKNGHEIAAHSNSHLDREEVDDIKLSIEKILTWTGSQKIGLVMPKSQDITPEIEEYLEKTDTILYYCDWRYRHIKRGFIGNIHRIINRLKRNKSSSIMSYAYSVKYDKKFLNRNKKARFDRITVKKDREAKYFINFLKTMPHNSCITIVFHSILNNYSEPCEWPEGAWDINEFETLVSFINSQKTFKVITQREAIELLK